LVLLFKLLLGFEVGDLPTDHSAVTRRRRQVGTACRRDPTRLDIASEDFERERQQRIDATDLFFEHAAALVYRLAALGSPWIVPRAALRAVAQLAAVAGVLAAAMSRLWSSVLVLAVMFVVAAATAARRSQARRGSWWLAGPLAVGLLSVLPLLLLSGVVPLNGFAIVPMVGIVLGGTMTAVAVAARRALDTLGLRVGEVEAALSLGLSGRDSRMEIIGRSAADALLPNLDQTRTVGVVTLPGAFVGVLLSTGSPVQAGAVQILILLALLLSQTCAVAATIELIARGAMTREHG
jgi:putative ABC transport system permease protein